MQKILFVFGTRPEAIKMAPVVAEFKKNQKYFDTRVCVTAQHREMLDQVLDFFDITPDYDLDLMKPGQNLYSLTAAVITSMKNILEEADPDFVFVHGDTSTTMSASLAAFYYGATVCHVEAGLRTYNKKAPFPEEINRQVTGRIADIHFAPTESAKQNLLNEGVPESSVCVTGNTVIDALFQGLEKLKTKNHPGIARLKELMDSTKKLILVTGHRRENFGDGFLNICQALGEIAERDDVQVIYPVHLNPNVQKPVYDILGEKKNIHLIAPLPYESFIWLMEKAKLIITDSGGIQEEAPGLGKPVLVMREVTERPEAVDAGTVLLVGTDKEKIVSSANHLLDDEKAYEEMSKLHNPYGDGHASPRIVEFLRKNKNL